MKRIIHSGTGLLLIGVAFLVFNMVVGIGVPNARLDLTEQKLYTISPGTERIIAELDEPVNLYFFFSDSLSRDLTPLRNYARRVEELLRAYERAAGGRIRLKVIDPAPFSEDEDRAAEFGLQAVPLTQGGDKLYFGLAGTNALDDVQTIAFFPLDQEEFLEYEISRLLQSLAKPERPVIGVLSGLQMSGGFNPLTGQAGTPWMLMEQIRQQFTIKSLQAGLDRIPDEVTVLLLVHPKELPQATLYAIDQFVLRGGKLLAFVDPYSESDDAGLMGEGGGNASDLEPLFKAWGLRLRPGEFLADASYAMAVGVGEEQQPVRHPAWLNLPAAAMDPDDVTTAGLESLTVASAGILEPLEGAKTRFTPLLHSSEYAMPMDAQRLAGLRDPRSLLRDLAPTGERYALAARVSGPVQSAFPDGIEGQRDGLKAADNLNLIVVADTDLLADRMWVQVQDFFGQRVPQPFADNAGFAINALDNLAGSDALISVRSRGRFSRPFVVVDNLQREAEARFREQEEILNQRLAQTEQRLAELQQGEDPEQTLELTPEQQAAVQQFLQERLAIRKELREVRYRLNADIESLGRSLKFVNIALVPLLLTVLVFGLWLLRRRRAD